jgi:hypothetical protein
VPVADLRSGANSIVFAVDNTINSWPPVLSSVDLLTFSSTGAPQGTTMSLGRQ